jgi:hypothetical protein
MKYIKSYRIINESIGCRSNRDGSQINLMNYIKTDDTGIIKDFIIYCDKMGINTSSFKFHNGNCFLMGKEFNRGAENIENLDDILGIGIFGKYPLVSSDTDMVTLDMLDFRVYIIRDIGDSEIAQWWNRILISEWEEFIDDFTWDIKSGAIVDILNKKLSKVRSDYPQFKIGTKMISIMDISYGWFKGYRWSPAILEGYEYCPIAKTFEPKTSKGGGSFRQYRVWDESILTMSTRELKNLL